MTATVDTITFWLFLGIWPIWGVWELALLWWRGQGIRVGTISMVAKDRASKLTCLVYLWAGLGAHYWWTGPHWAPAWSALLFWAVAVGLLVEDVALWGGDKASWPAWLRWQRWPPLWLCLGVLSGRFLFPQATN